MTINDGALTKEQAFLIESVSDYIFERKTIVPDGLDISILKKLSSHTALSSIVYYQTKIPELKKSFSVAPFYAENRRMMLGKIGEKFCENGIKYLVFKGPEVARYYRHPNLRSSGDTDILVNATDKEKAGEVLEGLGMICTEKPIIDHEWIYKKTDFEVELHHKLLYDDEYYEKDINSFTDKAWDYAQNSEGTRYALEKEYHFIYLLLHIRKHILWSGIGIRQFVDIAIMMKYASLDWDKIEKYIRECKIEGFAKTCFALIERTFGVKAGAKAYAMDISDEFYIDAIKKMFSDGVFGKTDRETLLSNEVANSSIKKGRIISALRVVFPSYQTIKQKNPNICKNNVIGRLLLPALWIKRFFVSAKKRTSKDRLSYVAKHFSDNTERNNVLKNWGIIDEQ